MKKCSILRPSRGRLFAVLVLASACSDSPVSPALRSGASHLTAEYTCIVDVQLETTSCRFSSPRLGMDGARFNVILGTPFVAYVTSTTYSDDNTGEDTATYTVRIRNATPQPLGTTDGTTLAPGGVRLFFTAGPTVVASSGGAASIRLETPDGTATFTNQNGSATYTNKAYFQYNEVLAPSDTTDPRSMRFIYSANVTSFSFQYRVSAPAQYEHGWITLAPSTAPLLAPGQTTTLTGTVYNQVGQLQGDGITWSSSSPSVATVNSSTGEVTAVGEGTAIITATSTVNAQRTGTRTIVVDAAPEVTATAPQDGATSVAPGDDIVVTFSEPVIVSVNSFLLECPISYESLSFTVSGSSTSTVTLDPDADLPEQTICTVTVAASVVIDADTNDGPDLMDLDYVFSFEVGSTGGP